MSLKIPKSLYVSELGEEFWRKPLYAEKLKQPHGTVNLIKDRCKGCEFCTEFCPQGILELSDDFNAKGYHPPKVIEKDGCIACRLCELMCPEFAIYITEDESAKKMEGPDHGSK